MNIFFVSNIYIKNCLTLFYIMFLINAAQKFSTYWRSCFLEVNVMRPAIAKRLHTPALREIERSVTQEIFNVFKKDNILGLQSRRFLC